MLRLRRILDEEKKLCFVHGTPVGGISFRVFAIQSVCSSVSCTFLRGTSCSSSVISMPGV